MQTFSEKSLLFDKIRGYPAHDRVPMYSMGENVDSAAVDFYHDEV